jgi:hypothetical protein
MMMHNINNNNKVCISLGNNLACYFSFFSHFAIICYYVIFVICFSNGWSEEWGMGGRIS